MATLWADIPEFEGKYQVSSSGLVRSLDRAVQCGIRTIRVKGRILRPGMTKAGYLLVMLGAENPRYVHILVAKAFVPNPDNKPEVNHEDGDKTNCNASNLTWMSSSEQKFHAWKTGLRKVSYDCKELLFLRSSELSIRQISKRTGVARATISKALLRC